MPDGTTFPMQVHVEPSPIEVAAFAAAYARALPDAVARYGVEGAVADAAILDDGSVLISLIAEDGVRGREVTISGVSDRFVFLRGVWDGEKRMEGHEAEDLAARILLAAGRLGGKFQKEPPASTGRRTAADPSLASRLALLTGAVVSALSALGHVGVMASIHGARSADGGETWGEIGLVVPGAGAFPVLVEVHERPLYRVAVIAGGHEIHSSTYDTAGFAAGFAAFHWHFDRHGPIGGDGPSPLELRRDLGTQNIGGERRES